METLSDYLDTLRRRWWVVAAVIVLVSVASLGMSFASPAVYASKAQVLVQDPLKLSVFDVASTRNLDVTREIETQIEIVRSPVVQAAAMDALGDDARWVGRVTARRVGQTDIIAITARSTRAPVAQAAADAWADAYIEQRKNQASQAVMLQRDEVEREAESIAEELAQIQVSIDAEVAQLTAMGQLGSARLTILSDQRATVESRYTSFVERADQLSVEAAVRAETVQKVAPASGAIQVAPDPVRDLGFALLGGTLLGLAIAFLVETLDESIRTREQAEKISGLPVLATVPYDSELRGRQEVVSLIRPESPVAEAYRTLRTNVRFLSVQHEMRRILVTSASAEDGKSTTATNLAVSMARDGARVILIDADLRRGSLHQYLNTASGPGLTTILLGNGDPSMVVREVDVPGGSLGLLTAGRLPPNPAELLGSNRFADILDQLSETADVVIVDVAPVLPVTDAAVLSREVDGVLVVVGAKKTGRKQLTGAVTALRQVGAPLLGVVLNRASREGDSTYGEVYKQREGSSRGSARIHELATAVPHQSSDEEIRAGLGSGDQG